MTKPLSFSLLRTAWPVLGLVVLAVAGFFHISQPADANNSSLNQAVNRGDYTQVSRLLNQGANPNGYSSSMREGSLLHTAVLKGDVENTRLLLERGANPNTSNGRGITPLYDAVARDQVQIVTLLLNHGANPNSEAAGVPPLHKAIERDRVSIVRLLLERGADPNTPDAYGKTPMDYARKHNQVAIQQLLQQFGAGGQTYGTPRPHTPGRYHEGSEGY
jgi:uncharacterized protein